MTSIQSPPKKYFATLDQQIADLVCNTTVPANELGKLPNEKNAQVKRVTLHLNSFKKNASDMQPNKATE